MLAASQQKSTLRSMPTLLGGDLLQIPPVLRLVDNHELPAHTLKACDWWAEGTHLKRYKFMRNTRAEASLEDISLRRIAPRKGQSHSRRNDGHRQEKDRCEPQPLIIRARVAARG